jgi:AraC family transcriptional regulator of arabinose operon
VSVHASVKGTENLGLDDRRIARFSHGHMPLLDLRLIATGVDFRHPAGFRIDRPRGSGDWLFLQFLSPVRLRDALGERSVPAGWCLMHAPGTAQWYGGDGGPFANHWCHFDGVGMALLIRQLGLPIDRAMPVAEGGAIAHAIAALDLERRRAGVHWQLAAAGGIIQLLVSLARAMAAAATATAGAYAEQLGDLRAEVHGRLSERWAVAAMARRLHLSPSRFAALYRTRFGVSPVEDLLRARCEHASHLLHGGVPVKAVATSCGFASVPYFTRQFRRRFGAPPAAWARTGG